MNMLCSCWGNYIFKADKIAKVRARLACPIRSPPPPPQKGHETSEVLWDGDEVNPPPPTQWV